MQVTLAYDGSEGAAHAIAAAGRLFAGATANVVVVPIETPPVPPDAVARMTAAIAEHRDEKIGAAVDHLGLLAELGRGVDHA